MSANAAYFALESPVRSWKNPPRETQLSPGSPEAQQIVMTPRHASSQLPPLRISVIHSPPRPLPPWKRSRLSLGRGPSSFAVGTAATGAGPPTPVPGTWPTCEITPVRPEVEPGVLFAGSTRCQLQYPQPSTSQAHGESIGNSSSMQGTLVIN